MGISAVTIGELVFGAEHSQQVERNLADIEAMVARLEVLPFIGDPIGMDTVFTGRFRDGLLPFDRFQRHFEA